MGGGVGEVHGAKLVGLLRRALRDRPDAVRAAGRVRRRAAARGQRRPDRGLGGDARAARRARRRHRDHRADRRRQRLLRRHGHRRALRRHGRDERHRAPCDVRPRGDRVVQRRRRVRLARPRAGVAHDRRQASLAHRRLRRARRRRPGRVPRRGDRRAGRASADDAGRAARRSRRCCSGAPTSTATTPTRSSSGRGWAWPTRAPCPTSTPTRCARCVPRRWPRWPTEARDGLARGRRRACSATTTPSSPTATSWPARAAFDGATLAVVGTTNHAAVGVELALRQARAVLDVVESFPGPAAAAAGRHAGPEAAPPRRAAGHPSRDGAPGLLPRPRAAPGPSGDRARLRPGAVRRLHHVGPDGRRLPRAARSRDPRDARARDGARDQAAGGAARVAVADQPRLRAGRRRTTWRWAACARCGTATSPRDCARRWPIATPRTAAPQEGAQRGGRRVAADVIRRVLEA